MLTRTQRRAATGIGLAGLAAVGLAGSLMCAVEIGYAICAGYAPPPPPPPPVEPAGTVPDDSREPTDPSPPDKPGGPTTGGGDELGGPTTGGGDDGGPITGGGGDGPLRGARTGARPRSGGVDPGHWTHWWYANRAFLLAEGSRVGARAAATPSARDKQGAELWRADARRALAETLSDDDDEVVAAAVLALGKGGDPADIPFVIRIAEDTDRGQASREAAAMALGILGGETAGDRTSARTTLQAMAVEKGAPERQRAIAILALGLRQEEASLPFLMDQARSGGRSWDVPAAALTALGLSGSEAARDELVRLLTPPKRGNERMRQIYAAHGLAKLGDVSALPALFDALSDKSDDVRRAAALSIGAIAPAAHKPSVDALERALRKDDDRGVRATSAVSLGLIGGDDALAALRRSYDKDDTVLRPFAAVAIGVLARRAERPRIAAPLLKDLKRGTRKELLGATCVAVGLAGLSDATPSLRELLSESHDPAVRAQAAVSLGLLGDRVATPPILRDILEDSNDPILRGECTRALGMLGDVRTLVALDEMATNGGAEHERITGILALGRIGGHESSSLLTGVLGDIKRSQLERHMAGNALGLLLDTSEGRRVGRIAADVNWYALTQAVFEVMAEM